MINEKGKGNGEHIANSTIWWGGGGEALESLNLIIKFTYNVNLKKIVTKTQCKCTILKENV